MSDATMASPGTTDALLDMVMSTRDVENFLTDLTKLAASTLTLQSSGEVLCGLTLLRPGLKATVASSSAHAQKMDEVQYAFDDGPCLRAARENYTVHIRNMSADTRFPAYRDAVAAHGIHTALGVPVRMEGDARAGLNFYSTSADAFNDDAVTAAESFAQQASKTLRIAIHMAQLSDARKNIEAALTSRTVIDLAVGIIMGQNRCSQHEAITMLKTASNTRNVKLRDIAASVVASTSKDVTRTHFEH